MYCNDLVLEKFMIFNKQLTKEEYIRIKDKIQEQLGVFKHPKQLTEQDKYWLKDNIEQYDEEVLYKIIDNSVLPDKPKENEIN